MRVFVVLGLLLLAMCCQPSKIQKVQKEDSVKELAPTGEKEESYALLKVNEVIHDFGSLSRDEQVSYAFKISNTGNSPLVIQKVESGCDCTHVSWPKKPIAPGKTDYLEVTLHVSGLYGKQMKGVAIYSNGLGSPQEVMVMAEVK